MSIQGMADTDDFDELHWAIIDTMLDGRERDEPWGFASPGTLSEATNESAQLINLRLRDLRMSDVVDKLDRGIYQINPGEVPDRDG